MRCATIQLCLFTVLALGGCDNGREKAPDRLQAQGQVAASKAADAAASTAVAKPSVSGKVFRYNEYSEEGSGAGVLVSAKLDAAGETKSYRIPGDAVSKYYTIESWVKYVNGDGENLIKTDRGKTIATLVDLPTHIGLRKTGNSIDIYSFWTADRDLPPRYEITVISNGRLLQSYFCEVDRSSFEKFSGIKVKSDEEWLGSSTTSDVFFDEKIVDMLTSTDPAIKRDHCGTDPEIVQGAP